MRIPVCAVFDIGKTNKKVFLFDEDYKIIWDKSITLIEITDEDGYPCEDLSELIVWINDTIEEILNIPNLDVKAVNFSAYGASLVYVGEDGSVITPLYNYLKPYPDELQKEFYKTYGGEENFATSTASPVLGSLNSGMQLYRLKKQMPTLFSKVKYSLHLPQFLSFLITKQFYTDFTSVGCHTNLWDFTKMKYHRWTSDENIENKFAPFHYAEYPIKTDNGLFVGIGLHDSSSAIIPYMQSFQEPFVLLSTGTWSISINPSNDSPLTFDELQNDCLCFLNYKERPIKASRLFIGYEHEIQVKRLAVHFNVPIETYREVNFDTSIIENIKSNPPTESTQSSSILKEIVFKNRDLANFKDYKEAYHQLIFDIILLQIQSTELVIKNSPVMKMFVDGGFSKNPIFMKLLAKHFPKIQVYAADVAQASALGAALILHPYWNQKSIPQNLISLIKY